VLSSYTFSPVARGFEKEQLSKARHLRCFLCLSPLSSVFNACSAAVFGIVEILMPDPLNSSHSSKVGRVSQNPKRESAPTRLSTQQPHRFAAFSTVAQRIITPIHCGTGQFRFLGDCRARDCAGRASVATKGKGVSQHLPHVAQHCL
jgi:hypothetical protein